MKSVSGGIGLVAVTALAASVFASVPAHAAEAAVPIAEVQGTTDVSPYAGKTVTVQGVVTGDYRTGGYKGIVIQTQGTGGTTKTSGASDGIFVYLNANTVSVQRGDLVSVTGKVSEYYGQTQITPAKAVDVSVVTAQVGLPAPVALPDTVVGPAREAYENMLVAPSGTYRVASSHQLYNYGSLWLSAGKTQLVKSTETKRPGAEADAIAAANRGNRILLDDGWSSQVTNSDHPGDQPYFTKDVVVRNGDSVKFPVEGQILQYGFDDWRLQPVVPIDDKSAASHKPTFGSDNPRPTTAPAVGGDVKIAAFNVENYFTTLQSENANARGAKTAEKFQLQKSKIVAGITGLDADIVGLMEIENSIHFGKPKDTALKDLVAGLNEKAGSDVWGFVTTPKALENTATTDVITTAIIFKKAAVTPVGDSSTVASDEAVWGNAREPIAQTFTAGGKVLTVIVNHLKSKSPPKGAGPEPADGQGFFNEDRLRQARSVLAFAESLKTSSGSTDIALVGDFNAYANEDPIDVFTAAGWTDLVPAKAQGQYTYSFNGELGSLDHVIVSPSLAKSVTGAGVWNINSAEWGDRDYAFAQAEAGTPFRSSDHDPIIVGLSSRAVPVDITVATINDFHGRIEAENASAGAAVLAGAVKQLRAERPNTIFAGAGDLIGASTFTSFIQNDNPTIDALNAAQLDVSAAGNHEFDQGWADLRDRVQTRANWEYISSNVFLKGTNKTALAPSWVKEVAGVRVGFIGAVTEDLPTLVSPDGIKELDVRSVVSSVNSVAKDLRDGDPKNGEADVIILLVHEGATTADASSITPDSRLGKIVNGVDKSVNAIVSAHTHLAYNHMIDGRPVVSAGQYGEQLGVMDLKVDPTSKKLLSISNEIRPLTKGGKPLYPADPEVQKIVDAAKKEADVQGAKSVGTISADFNRAVQSDGKTENRGGESTLGNFVADVQQWSTGADVAIMNPGGLRANLTFASSGGTDPDGNVTYREAATVQPFANTLVTLKLTGAQLKSVLEEQWQPAGAARPFLKLGISKAMTYTYDPTAAAGKRITRVLLNGKPLNEAATYTVAANAFLAAGGDNFTTFAQGVEKKDTGKVDLQSMVEWFAANKSAKVDVAQRAVGVQLSPATGAGYKPGDTVELALSSLAFSTNEQKPAKVSVALGGTVLASSDIDATPVDAGDEVGRAKLSVVLPAGVNGEQSLTIQAGATTLSVPITVTGGVTPPVKTPKLALGSESVAAGETVSLRGTGFAAQTALAVELHSDPVRLGSVQTDAEGAFGTTLTIPAATPAGKHTIVVKTATGDVRVAITVVQRITGGGADGGGLAVTGVDVAPGVVITMLLFGLGAVLVALRRRARQS